jgi:MFS family permease
MTTARPGWSSWKVVAASGIGMGFGTTTLVTYTPGVFFSDLARDIGLTRTQFGTGYLGTTLALALGIPVVGWVVDRAGVRNTVLAGAMLLALGFFLLGTLAVSPWSYITLMTLVGILGAGASPVGYTRAVTVTFERGRGTALGICMTVVGIAAAFLPQIAAVSIAHFGWHGGYVVLGVIALMTIPFSFLWLRIPSGEPPSERSSPPVAAVVNEVATADRPTAFFRSAVFWILLAGFALVALSFFGFMVHLVPLVERAGVGKHQAVQYASVLGISGLLSRLVAGAISDLVHAPWIMVVAAALVAANLLLISGGDPHLFWLLACTLGFVVGAEVDLLSYLTARYFPGRIYGRVYAWIYSPTILASGLSSVWIGACADRFGDYSISLKIAAAAGALGGLLFLLLPAYQRVNHGIGRSVRAFSGGES